MPPGHWPPAMTCSCNCAKFAPNMPNARLSLNVSSVLGAYDLARSSQQAPVSAKRYIAAHETLRKLAWEGKNLELAAELRSTWLTT
jgi:hypothetical protein